MIEEKLLKKFTDFVFIVLSLMFVHSANAEQQNKINLAENNDFANESYRLTLDFKTPRRYSTRFDKETRTLQIRIIPARASEVKNSAFYDPRYIQRVLVEEKESEVTLNLQLKNFPIAWLVATKEKPWRIVLDFWKSDNEELSLNKKWNWQPNLMAEVADDDLNKDGLPSVGQKLPSSKKESSSTSPSFNAFQNSKIKGSNSFYQGSFFNSKKYGLPEIYSRIELVKPSTDARRSELQKQIGNVFGSPNEFLAAKNLADELYASGQEEKALTIYRKLAALDEEKFKSSDKILWQAGESAYLLKNFDIANDYFRILLLNNSGSTYAPYAKLRITDIDELLQSKGKGLGKVGDKNGQIYANLALNDNNPSLVKIAASLRLLDGNVDENPDAVKIYQQNLDTCVTSGRVPFDLLKNCAYDRDRYLAEKDNIINADNAVQGFKKLSPGDPRTANLENIVQGRVKKLLSEVAQNKDWNSWVEFEKKVRPILLYFSFSDSESLFTRANAFEAVGDNKKSIQLYESYIKNSKDNKMKNEASALTSLLLYRMNEPEKAIKYLKLIEQNQARKSEGLTDRSVAALKEISLPPYKNKVALNVLMDELKLGRYEERTLSTLSEWSKLLRGKPQAELIYEKILAYPAKSSDDVQVVESSILQFADDLRESGRFAKAGDMFFAVSNLSQGTRRAEAAYKAGVVYARAGLFEKAKTAWLLAANDTNDKRYSSLANERLDRINK